MRTILVTFLVLLTVAAQAAVTVTIKPAAVSVRSAVLRADVVTPAEVWANAFYGTADHGTDTGAWTCAANMNSSTSATLTAYVQGLDAETAYYMKWWVTNAFTSVWSSVSTFTTLVVPAAETGAVYRAVMTDSNGVVVTHSNVVFTGTVQVAGITLGGEMRTNWPTGSSDSGLAPGEVYTDTNTLHVAHTEPGAGPDMTSTCYWDSATGQYTNAPVLIRWITDHWNATEGFVEWNQADSASPTGTYAVGSEGAYGTLLMTYAIRTNTLYEVDNALHLGGHPAEYFIDTNAAERFLTTNSAERFLSTNAAEGFISTNLLPLFLTTNSVRVVGVAMGEAYASVTNEDGVIVTIPTVTSSGAVFGDSITGRVYSQLYTMAYTNELRFTHLSRGYSPDMSSTARVDRTEAYVIYRSIHTADGYPVCEYFGPDWGWIILGGEGVGIWTNCLPTPEGSYQPQTPLLATGTIVVAYGEAFDAARPVIDATGVHATDVGGRTVDQLVVQGAGSSISAESYAVAAAQDTNVLMITHTGYGETPNLTGPFYWSSQYDGQWSFPAGLPDFDDYAINSNVTYGWHAFSYTDANAVWTNASPATATGVYYAAESAAVGTLVVTWGVTNFAAFADRHGVRASLLEGHPSSYFLPAASAHTVDPMTLTLTGTRLAVSPWIPELLISDWFEHTLSEETEVGSWLGGHAYVFTDQGGILPEHSTNWMWTAPWYGPGATVQTHGSVFFDFQEWNGGNYYMASPPTAAFVGHDWSVTAWIKPLNAIGYNQQSYVSFGGLAMEASAGSAGDFHLFWSGTTVDLLLDAPLPLDEWASIALTYNGTAVSLYTNGVLAVSANCSLTMTESAISIARGQVQGVSFNGCMAEVSLWDRALSGAEVVTAATTPANTSVSPWDSGLVVGWRLDDLVRTFNEGEQRYTGECVAYAGAVGNMAIAGGAGNIDTTNAYPAWVAPATDIGDMDLAGTNVPLGFIGSNVWVFAALRTTNTVLTTNEIKLGTIDIPTAATNWCTNLFWVSSRAWSNQLYKALAEGIPGQTDPAPLLRMSSNYNAKVLGLGAMFAR